MFSYDPRSNEIITVKSRAMCKEYLPDGTENPLPYGPHRRLSKAELEKIHIYNNSLEEPGKKYPEDFYVLWGAVQGAIEAQFFELLTLFSDYFTATPREELELLFKDIAMYMDISREIDARNALLVPSEAWPEERQEAYRARMSYLFAKQRVDGLRREYDSAKEYLGAMRQYIIEKYPGCLDDEF